MELIIILEPSLSEHTLVWLTLVNVQMCGQIIIYSCAPVNLGVVCFAVFSWQLLTHILLHWSLLQNNTVMSVITEREHGSELK